METQPDLEFQRVLENVRSHFAFLFQRGYQISAAMFTDAQNENWNVVLTGDNCLIEIHYRDEKLHLLLCTTQLFGKTGMFDLHELVHLIHRGSKSPRRRKSLPDETEQLITTSLLLEEHIDEILTLFQKIHLGIAFSRAGQLFTDKYPALFFTRNSEAAHVASA